MAFSLRNVQSNTVAYLRSCNTTTCTWDISAGLQARMLDNSIMMGSPKRRPRGMQQLASVWVALGADREDWASLGPNAQRLFDWSLEITVASTGAGPEAAQGGNDSAEQYMAALANNVSSAIRNNPNLAVPFTAPGTFGPATAALVRVARRGYNQDVPNAQESIYVAAAVLEVEGRTLST